MNSARRNMVDAVYGGGSLSAVDSPTRPHNCEKYTPARERTCTERLMILPEISASCSIVGSLLVPCRFGGHMKQMLLGMFVLLVFLGHAIIARRKTSVSNGSTYAKSLSGVIAKRNR